MTDTGGASSQADNITMSGGGVYSLATAGAKDVIDHATPRVMAALEQIDPPASHWSFADMGCADGGTSLDLWRRVAGVTRERSQADIQITYADQPRNDFNALVQILHGLTDFKTYRHEHKNLHVLASGSSFYEPVVPAGTLDLCFSATAMHWLSCKPCDIPDHVHMVGASGDVLNKFQQQARTDWETILLHRARELKPGGKLVLANFCRDENGCYLGNTGGENMFDNFNNLWCELRDSGVISQQEYAAMTLPQYYNTVEEFAAPFENKNSAVVQAGLTLDSIETGIIPCPYKKDFKQHGDAKKFAAEFIPTIRSWNESIYYGGLSDHRSSEERSEIIQNFYQTYENAVAQKPDDHAMDYVHAYMTVAKK